VSTRPSPGSSSSATTTRTATETDTPVGSPSNTLTASWTASFTPTISKTETRSYTGSATMSPTMTMLNVGAAQTQTGPSNSIAIAGIVSGAAVVGILGIIVILLIVRRPSRSPATPLVFHEDVSIVKNPGLSCPPTPEFDYMGRPFPIINNTFERILLLRREQVCGFLQSKFATR
jgi:hypothetical protein